jgi:hypothetical protein
MTCNQYQGPQFQATVRDEGGEGQAMIYILDNKFYAISQLTVGPRLVEAEQKDGTFRIIDWTNDI